MKIIFNGSPSEAKSPFFLKNKEICFKWKRFIEAKGGAIGGQCNAWSFQIHGFIDNSFELLVKKSTFSSGYILLPKDQGLFVQTDFSFHVDLGISDFEFRRSNRLDLFRKLLFSDKHHSVNFKKYHFVGMKKIQNDETYNSITTILAYGIRKKELNSIKYNSEKKELTISSRSTNLFISEVEKLFSILEEL